MKRFIVSMLCASVFFIGLGSLVEKAGAKFKSDEKALALIKKARTAIGGDANIASVRSLTISGKATQSFTLDGTTKSEQGELEINMQLPNQFSRTLKFGSEGDNAGLRKEMNVFVVRKDGEAPPLDQIEGTEGKRNIVITRKDGADPMVFRSEGASPEGTRRFVIKKGDGNVEEIESADGNKILVNKDIHQARGVMRHNELFRTAFALFLTAPEGVEASYTYVGEADVEGNSCDIVQAEVGGESFKLYLDKATALPRMMTYKAVKPLIIKFNKEEAKSNVEKERAFHLRNAAERLETAEYQVKFSDYRSVGGLQMPYKWTQTVGGQDDQIIDIANYEINPANIAEKFQKPGERTFIRTVKPQ